MKIAQWVDGAQGRDRTTDTVIFSHVLYQLSYLGAEARRNGGPERAVYKGSVLSRQGGFGRTSGTHPAAAQSLLRSRGGASCPSESSSDSTAGIA